MELNVPWFVVGDFNTMLSSSEKKEGRFPRHLYMEEFRDCLLRCSLFYAGFGILEKWYDAYASNVENELEAFSNLLDYIIKV